MSRELLSDGEGLNLRLRTKSGGPSPEFWDRVAAGAKAFLPIGRSHAEHERTYNNARKALMARGLRAHCHTTYRGTTRGLLVWGEKK